MNQFRQILSAITPALLIILFVYAAASKLLDHSTFRLQLSQSPLLHSWAGVISWVLPVGELLLAGLLVWPGTRLPGFYSALLLLILFTLYIMYMLIFLPHLPCSCGGVIRYLSWKQHVVFNGVFIALAVVGIRLQRKEHKVCTA